MGHGDSGRGVMPYEARTCESSSAKTAPALLVAELKS